MSADKLLTLPADELAHVADLMAGKAFEVSQGTAKSQGDAPGWLIEAAARALGVTDGQVVVPTAAAIKAAQAKVADQAREAAALDQADKGNPYRRGPTFNLTRQVEMERETPELAARLKARAAGTTDNLTRAILLELGQHEEAAKYGVTG